MKTDETGPGMTDDAGGFGPRLGACRRLAGLSQEELAARSGLSTRTVRNLERGRTQWPYPDSVRRLADALDLRGQSRGEFIAAARRRLGHSVAAPDAPVSASAEDQAPPGDARMALTRQQAGASGSSPTPRCWQPVFQLPAAPADFTGRAGESERLIRAITPRQAEPGVPLVAVSGPPGAGKTSLALHAAHMTRARFCDGQLWVHLAGASPRPRDPGEVLGELLRVLGVAGTQIPPSLEGRAASYRSRLAGRNVLIVADDAAAEAQVRPLLPGTAGCAMVVTSRVRLEGLDGAHLLPLDVLGDADAVGLLAAIVGQDRVAAERSAADCLVQACGALPLALRIAGAKLATRPSWPLSLMVGKLAGAQGRLGVLESGGMSVRASIASSYRALPEPARRAFGLLALLGPADFADWTVDALLGASGAVEVIAELTGRSLLAVFGTDATGEPRYRLHDLLREFAAECLSGEPEASKHKAQERLLEAWLQLSTMADACLPSGPYFLPRPAYPPPAVLPAEVAGRLTADPIAWFSAEWVNLLAAVEQACATGRLDLASQLASVQSAFRHYQGRFEDAGTPRQPDDPAAASCATLRLAPATVPRGQAVGAASRG